MADNIFLETRPELSRFNLTSRFRDIRKKISETLFIPYVAKISISGVSARFAVNGPTSKMEVQTFGHEEGFLKDFVKNIESGQMVIDVGARHGLFTILSAVKCLNSSFLAIEPDPDNVNTLKHNIALNGLANVSVLPIAIDDCEGISNLMTSGAEGKSPRLDTVNLVPKDVKKFRRKIAVKTTTLDNLLSGDKARLPDVLKIDVEGAELHLLNGAKMLLSGDLGKKPQRIYIELHEGLIPSPFTTSSAKDQLARYGYRLGFSETRKSEELCRFDLVI